MILALPYAKNIFPTLPLSSPATHMCTGSLYMYVKAASLASKLRWKASPQVGLPY